MINVILDSGAYMPHKAHREDAGFDLKTPRPFKLKCGQTVTIDTGVHVEIPKGYVGMLKSKSGLNVKYGITSEGVIDAGYTGSIVCKLRRDWNNANGDDVNTNELLFETGDKITQLVIMPILDIGNHDLKEVKSFETTERGNGGFGSTGR